VPCWVQWRVSSVVVEERQLNRVITGPIESRLIEFPVVGADVLLIACAIGVLKLSCRQGEKLANLGLGIRIALIGQSEDGAQKSAALATFPLQQSLPPYCIVL